MILTVGQVRELASQLAHEPTSAVVKLGHGHAGRPSTTLPVASLDVVLDRGYRLPRSPQCRNFQVPAA